MRKGRINMKQDLIEKIKVLLLFGKRNVDGEERDGQVEKILVEEDDTAHYFYMKVNGVVWWGT